MTDATEQFFEDLSRRAHEPLLAKVTGTLRFDLVDGKTTRRWLVAVNKGDVSVMRRSAQASCVLRADKTLFDGVASGRVNAMAALLRGEMGVEGEVELLVLFQRLFPAPPPSRGQRRTVRRRTRR